MNFSTSLNNSDFLDASNMLFSNLKKASFSGDFAKKRSTLSSFLNKSLLNPILVGKAKIIGDSINLISKSLLFFIKLFSLPKILVLIFTISFLS